MNERNANSQRESLVNALNMLLSFKKYIRK